jgi:hypothetical protein
MSKQVDELMALAWEMANALSIGAKTRTESELRTALEAVLKPEEYGEADVWHEGSRSFYRANLLYKLTPEEVDVAPPAQTPPKQEPRTGVWGYIDAQVARDMQGFYEAFGTATPPTQTPNGLFVDLIAQHPGLAEELKAIDDMPMSTWTPPPLLTEMELKVCLESAKQQWSKNLTTSPFIPQFVIWHIQRAIESAVRKQFLGRDE